MINKTQILTYINIQRYIEVYQIVEQIFKSFENKKLQFIVQSNFNQKISYFCKFDSVKQLLQLKFCDIVVYRL